MDALTQKIVNNILSAIRPEKIILFGSRAQGTAGQDSDVDLVIIYSGPLPKRELQITIHKLFPHPDFSLDVFIMSPEEMENQRFIANTLAREVSEKGIVCYG